MRLDLATGRLVARVVYDGSASAGKTTNVRQLAASFRARCTSAVETPVELAGRTLYFDWITLRAGHIHGLPLTCEVLTSPGQTALESRRDAILATADVVVHVCDARPEALDETAANLRWTLGRLAARAAPVPLVIQANKQDDPDALDRRDLAIALGDAAWDAQITEAIARDGVGVVDTFLAAIEALAASVETGGADPVAPVIPGGGPQDLLDQLEALPIDRAWLAELFLEAAEAEAEAAVRAIRRDDATADRGDARELARPELPGQTVPLGHVWPAVPGRAALAEIARAASDATIQTSAQAPTELALGAWQLWTSPAHRFDDERAARASLLERAREHARLQRSPEGDAILVLERAADDALWLWTLRPATQGTRT